MGEYMQLSLCIFVSEFLGLSTLCVYSGHDRLILEKRRKEGDTVKKVMLLASKDMCDILRHALDDKYTILPCSDTVTGAELLKTGPDALILELPLPEANGMTFLRTHSDNLPPITIILTPYIDDRILADLMALGVSSVVLMPFRVSYLVSLLSDQVEIKCPSR